MGINPDEFRRARLARAVLASTAVGIKRRRSLRVFILPPREKPCASRDFIAQRHPSLR